MKKIIFILCLGMFIPVSAFAEASAFANSCLSVNKTRILDNEEYLCTKQKNGKNVWVKKITVRTPILLPKPIPTPTVVTPTPLPSPVVQTPATKLENIHQIYKNMSDSFETKSQNFKITVIKSPMVNEKRVEEIVSAYEKSINSYQIPTSFKITWVFVSENEKDWWIKKSLQIDSRPNPTWWNSDHCKISSVVVCGYGNASINNPIFYMVVGSSSKWEANHQIIADHEAVHMYQVIAWSSAHANCWVVEGHANAMGIAMSAKVSDMTSYRQSQIVELRKIFPKYKSFSVEDWINAYNRINSDSNFCFNNNAGYSMGMIAIESMYSFYDGKKVNQFLVDYSKTRNFNQSLISHFNINENQFYKNVAEYAKKSVSSN